MEHFCSIDQYKAGQQDQVYADFFKNLYELLPVGGRFYMQTMVFGKNMIPLEEISVNAPKESPSYALALMIAQFPGSWLPYGAEQVIRNAQPRFKLISTKQRAAGLHRNHWPMAETVPGVQPEKVYAVCITAA